MKRLMSIALAAAFAVVCTSPALAADNPQQQRMKNCNTQATGKKGDERKAFMKECLSAEKKASDSKMGACNTQSKGMKGDAHKKFMSECMKKAA